MIFSLIIPTGIILIPISGFIIYRFRIKRCVRSKILISGLFTMLLGVILPWIAMFVSANRLAAGMPDDSPKCVSGAAAFWFLGYLINLIGIPLIGFIFYIFAKEPDTNNVK